MSSIILSNHDIVFLFDSAVQICGGEGCAENSAASRLQALLVHIAGASTFTFSWSKQQLLTMLYFRKPVRYSRITTWF